MDAGQIGVGNGDLALTGIVFVFVLSFVSALFWTLCRRSYHPEPSGAVRSLMSKLERGFGRAASQSAGAGIFLLLVVFSPSVAGSTWSPRAAFLLLVAGLGLVPLVRAAQCKEAVPALLLGWTAWAAVAALSSPQPALATVGLHNWGTGWLFVLTAGAAWAVGRDAEVQISSALRSGFLVGAGTNAAVGFVQWSRTLHVFPFELSEGRSSGLVGNPLHLGALCAGALVLVATGDRRPAKWAYLAAALFGVGVAVSGSRSSLALAAAAALVAAVRGRWGSLALLVTGLAAGVTFGAVWGAPTTASESRTAAARIVTAGGAIEARTGMWATALLVAADDPVTGAGPGRFRAATAHRRPLAVARAEGPDRLFVDAHNIVIEYLVTTGLPGAVLLLAALFLAFRRAGGEWLGCALVLAGAHMTSPQSVATTPILFLALGLAQPRRRSPLPFRRMDRPVRKIACGLGIAAGAILLRGDFLLNEARLDVEVADARAAESLLPRWPQPARRMAIAYAFRAQAEGNAADERLAIRWFAEAARRAPDDASGWSDLADRYLQNGDVDAAETMYRRALRSNRYSTRALNGLARALLAAGRAEDARRFLQRSLFVDPDQPAVRSALGR